MQGSGSEMVRHMPWCRVWRDSDAFCALMRRIVVKSELLRGLVVTIALNLHRRWQCLSVVLGRLLHLQGV